jgi:hypothetical protein
MIMTLRGRFKAATSSLSECAVEDGHGGAAAFHVEDEVLAHHRQADQSEVRSRAIHFRRLVEGVSFRLM